uniref:Uncharacterized protein n=1 Tax=Anopheles culicifacies TaxID=139723 RepID=A0A182MLE0_9DIPT
MAATEVTVAGNSNTCISLPSSSVRRCISDNENYLLTRSSCGFISKSSKSSYDRPVESEPCSSDSTITTTNQTLNQISRIYPIQNKHLHSATDDNSPFRSGSTADSSSLAVMLYDASAIPYGYASVANDGTDHLLRESRTFLTGTVQPVETHGSRAGMSGYVNIGSVERSASMSQRNEVVNVSLIEDLTDKGTSGGGSGKSKFSSSSPFRRFGMAMRRGKKRSLKLKHVAGSSSGIGGNTLHGSCASNLSGISMGNGSAKGVVLGTTTANDGGAGSSKRTKLKFRWLRNMRSDPNLKETLAKSVQLRTTTISSGPGCILEVAKGGTTTTSNVTIPKSPTTTSKMSIPDIASSVGAKLTSGIVEDMKEITCCNLPTDYYSFLCDNQLSYESPGKSPGHLMRLELALARRPSTIEEVLQQPGPPTPPPRPPSPSSPAAITVSDTDCSVVKPRASNVKIGFNVSPAPASPVDTVHGSIESSFEIIEKCDALMDPSENLPPGLERTTDGDAGGPLLSVSGGGHSFCNKLLQHIVTSVSGGRKLGGDPTVSIDCKKQDCEGSFEYSTATANIATNSIRRSSSSCSALTVVQTLSSPVLDAGGSPVLSRSNRCAPFSFRELRSELRAAMKIPIPKHRTQPTSSSSSSSSNIAGVTGGGSSAVRSIERTLSAPVAVQTLESDIGNNAITCFTPFAANTTSTSANASSANGLLPTLNRSQSDRQLGDDHRSSDRSGLGH